MALHERGVALHERGVALHERGVAQYKHSTVRESVVQNNGVCTVNQGGVAQYTGVSQCNW